MFVIESRKGNVLLVDRAKKGKGIKPRFLLRRQVTLPARHWFSRPIARKLPELRKMMSAEGLWVKATDLSKAGGKG
jgi:hypothetical protein